jgi:hypothetical protein
MNTMIVLSYIQMGLNCIFFLVGMAGGIIALVRKKTLLGILATTGFFLLGLNLIINMSLGPIVSKLANSGNFSGSTFSTLYSWLSFCLSMPVFLLGIGALIAFVFSATGKKTKTEVEELPEIPPLP